MPRTTCDRSTCVSPAVRSFHCWCIAPNTAETNIALNTKAARISTNVKPSREVPFITASLSNATGE